VLPWFSTIRENFGVRGELRLRSFFGFEEEKP
jgi:hypothetical protein